MTSCAASSASASSSSKDMQKRCTDGHKAVNKRSKARLSPEITRDMQSSRSVDASSFGAKGFTGNYRQITRFHDKESDEHGDQQESMETPRDWNYPSPCEQPQPQGSPAAQELQPGPHPQDVPSDSVSPACPWLQAPASSPPQPQSDSPPAVQSHVPSAQSHTLSVQPHDSPSAPPQSQLPAPQPHSPSAHPHAPASSDVAPCAAWP